MRCISISADASLYSSARPPTEVTINHSPCTRTIEHFDCKQTSLACEAHFRLSSPCSSVKTRDMPQHNHDRFGENCNPNGPRNSIKDQPIIEGPSEEDHELKTWIVDLCTTTSSDAPAGKPDFNNTFGHGWMTSENLAAGNLAGATDLSNPAGEWDEEERKRPLLLPARVGTYPLGDFVFTRDEGSSNVAINMKEGSQALRSGG